MKIEGFSILILVIIFYYFIILSAFGQIYIAKSSLLKKKVAIKKVRNTEKDKVYNYLEIAFLKKTEHPNIVNFIEAFEVINPKSKDEEVWIVMEYLQGFYFFTDR